METNAQASANRYRVGKLPVRLAQEQPEDIVGPERSQDSSRAAATRARMTKLGRMRAFSAIPACGCRARNPQSSLSAHEI